MREVAHLDIDEKLEKERVAAGHFEIGDVAAIVADNACQHRKRARCVLYAHPHARNRVSRVSRMYVPAYVEPITHAAFRVFEFGTIDGVDDGALARNHQTDDAVARQRMTAFSEPIGNSLRQTPDGNRLL